MQRPCAAFPRHTGAESGVNQTIGTSLEAAVLSGRLWRAGRRAARCFVLGRSGSSCTTAYIPVPSLPPPQPAKSGPSGDPVPASSHRLLGAPPKVCR